MSVSMVCSNNLIVSIDWLSYTVSSSFSVDEVIEFMGFDCELFEECHAGAHGYKRMRKYENISVLYDGNDNMGIHVNISSQSIFSLFEHYSKKLECYSPFGIAYDMGDCESVLAHFLSTVHKIGHLTRIDIAIDDKGCKYYSLDELENECKLLHVRSKWRRRESIVSKTINSDVSMGHTINFGSRTSGIMLRVYDKKLERNQFLSPDDSNYIYYEWVRWELELHKEVANNIIQCIEYGMSIADVGMGILNNYFNIINLDDSNRSRCSCQSKWLEFVQNVSKVRVSSKKNVRTIYERVDNFTKQNGRLVSLFTLASSGDSTFWSDIARRYESKLTLNDKIMVDSFLKSGDVL